MDNTTILENMLSDEALSKKYGTTGAWLVDRFGSLNGQKLFANEPAYSFGKEEKTKNAWTKISKINQFKKTLVNASRVTSVIGKAYISLFETTDGVMFNIADHGMHTMFGNRLIETFTYQTLLRGDQKLFYIMERATNKIIERSVMSEDEDGNMQEFDISVLETDFGITLEPVFEHNYGEVPVVLIENMPMPDGNGRPDVFGLEFLIDLLDTGLVRVGFEVDGNKTRIVIYAGDGTAYDEVMKTISSNAAAQELLDTGGITIVPSAQSEYDVDGQVKQTEVIVGTPQTETLWKHFQTILTMIYETAGYTNDTTEGRGLKGAQQSEFEVAQQRNSEISAFKVKQGIWQDAITKLIQLALKIQENIEIEEEEVSVVVNLLNIKNETALITNTKMLMEMGIMDKSNARAVIENIPYEEAKEFIDSLNKEEMMAFAMTALAKDGKAVEQTVANDGEENVATETTTEETTQEATEPTTEEA